MFIFINLILFVIINCDSNKNDKCNTLVDNLHKKEINANSDLKEINNCIDILIQQGSFNKVDNILNILSSQDIPFRKDLYSLIDNNRSKLKSLLHLISLNETDYQTVTPSLRWAQSLQNIFIEIKFAHRFDSPGCIDITNINHDYMNNTHLHLNASCILGETPIKFNLHFELFKPINHNQTVYSSSSVGRYHITLYKSHKTYWKRLPKREEDIINMRSWFEMAEKYRHEFKQIDKNKDNPAYIEAINNQYKNKKRKTKQKQNKNTDL
jgi:hypothetical protein